MSLVHDLVHSLNYFRMPFCQVMLLTCPFKAGYFDQVSGFLVSETRKERVADMMPFVDLGTIIKNP